MHRSILTPLIIYFLFTVATTAQVADVESELWDQVYFCKQSNEFLSYYIALETLEDYYVKTLKDSECLHLLDDQYNLLPTTTLDTFNFRKYVGYHAFYLERYCSDLLGAKAFYELAFQYNRSPNDLGERCWNLEKRLATIYAQLNDREREVYFLKLVEKKLTELNDTSKLLRLYADLGGAYLALKDTAKAIAIFDRAFEDSYKDNYHESTQGLGLHLLTISSKSKFTLEEINKSIRLAINSLRQDRSYSESIYSERLSNNLDVNADIAFSNSDYDLAIKNYEQAFTYLEKRYQAPSRELAKLHLKIALSYKEKNEIEKAKEMLQLALNQLVPGTQITDTTINEKVWTENTFNSIFEAYSDCLIEGEINTSKIREAKRYLDLSIAINQALHDEILLSSDRYISLEYNKDLVSKALNLCRLLYDEGHQKEAKTWATKLFKISKNQQIREEILKSNQTQHLSDDVQESIRKIKKELKVIVNQGNPIGNSKYLALNERLINYFNGNNNVEKNGRKEFTSSVEYTIGKDFVYTYYIKDSTNYFSWAEKDSVVFYSEKILSHLDNLTDEKSILANTKILSSLILPPFNLENEVVFIPDGFLHSFPFDLLIQNNAFLFKSCAIRINIGQTNPNDNLSLKKESKISFIDGKYSHLNSSESKTYASNRSEPSILQFTEKEIFEIEQIFGKENSQRLSDQSFENALSNSSNSNILHYTGHAKAHDNRAFIIHGYNDTLEFIYEEEIALINQQFDLVTLSACETGLGQFKPGDGVKNLCNAFLKSGSKTVVYSNWLVDDYSTSQLMGFFYKYIAAGMKKSEALRQAKLEYLQEANPLKKHPYYWASFSLTGNDKPLEINKTKPYRYLIFGFALLLFIALFIYTKRTRK